MKIGNSNFPPGFTVRPKSISTMQNGGRLASLDFYRGIIMVLLMAESTGLYDHLVEHTDQDSFLHSVSTQFTHHLWHGLHFWDLIQPAFMFIAGTAMAISLTRQTLQGISRNQQAIHTLKRSSWLFFWGILDYTVRGDHLSFELWDVLTQLSFTMLIAYLIFNWKPAYQLLFSFGLLLLTESLYRFTKVPGFDQPFTDQHNFGNYVDVILMNKINPGGWVAINCIPTAAHTIWGAVAGKWMLSPVSKKNQIGYLAISGIAALALGYTLDFAGITPIIKRIATSSFTLVSGGYCLLMLSFLFYWIDIAGHKKWLLFFTIVSMNSIFIYLFFEIVMSRWLLGYISTIVNGVISPTGIPETAILFITSFVAFIFEWALCYWLYRKKIFFKV